MRPAALRWLVELVVALELHHGILFTWGRVQRLGPPARPPPGPPPRP